MGAGVIGACVPARGLSSDPTAGPIIVSYRLVHTPPHTDYDYRGPVGVVLFNHGQEDFPGESIDRAGRGDKGWGRECEK